jgi:hypothetical protein
MQWRQCPGRFRYEVSEHGDVRIIESGKRLRGIIDPDGYVRYGLIGEDGVKRSPAAHTLVAEAYIGPRPSPNHEVAHNNGSRLYNHFTNLRWATSAENHSDRFEHGTAAQGEHNGRAKITEADVHYIRREYHLVKVGSSTETLVSLERRFGIHRATLVSIAKGKSWSHIPMPQTDDLYAKDAA